MVFVLIPAMIAWAGGVAADPAPVLALSGWVAAGLGIGLNLRLPARHLDLGEATLIAIGAM